MAIKTGISKTSENSFTIGGSTNVDGYVYFDNGQTNKPGIRYNSSVSKIQHSGNGTIWSDIGSLDSLTLSGDCSGSLSDVTVTGIYTYPINTPLINQGLLQFNLPNNSYPDAYWSTNAPGGDVSGSISNIQVIGIRGRSISSVTPNDGYILKYNSSLTQWEPKHALSNVNFSKDLSVNVSNNTAVATVTGIQGIGISSTIPIDGYTIVYNQNQNLWKPGILSDSVNTQIVGGRLSLRQNIPVMNGYYITGATTLYFCPYKGNQIALYSNSSWAMYTIDSNSLSITNSELNGNTNYDVFIYPNGNVPTLIFGEPWDSDTERAEELVYQDGVLVKADTKSRYLGTIRTYGETPTFEYNINILGVWNYYNRIDMMLFDRMTTTSWTLSSGTSWRPFNNAVNHNCYVEMIIGYVEDCVKVNCMGVVSNATGSAANVSVGIGVNSEDTNSSQLYGGGSIIDTDSRNQINSYYEGYLSTTPGYFRVAALEDNYYGGDVTMYGTFTDKIQTGLLANLYA